MNYIPITGFNALHDWERLVPKLLAFINITRTHKHGIIDWYRMQFKYLTLVNDPNALPSMIETESFIIPLLDEEIIGYGTTTTLFGNGLAPWLVEQQISAISTQSVFGAFAGMFHIEANVNESIIQVSYPSFSLHLDSLNEINKAWDSNPGITLMESVDKRVSFDVVRADLEYHVAQATPAKTKPRKVSDVEVELRAQSIMNHPTARLFLVCEDKAPIGYLQLDVNPATNMAYWVTSLMVRDERHVDHGIDTWLILKALEWCYNNLGSTGSLNMGGDMPDRRPEWQTQSVIRECAYLK